MEAAARARDAVRAWWAGLPPLPDPDLPAPGDPAIVIVAGTVVLALGLMGWLTARVEGRRSLVSLGAVLVGAGLLLWVWDADREGFGWLSVPTAFVEMLARVVR